jgi:hypothetical protein
VFRNGQWIPPAAAGAGSSGGAVLQCPPGTAACVHGWVDLPGGNTPAYNSETNSTILFEGRF